MVRHVVGLTELARGMDELVIKVARTKTHCLYNSLGDHIAHTAVLLLGNCRVADGP